MFMVRASIITAPAFTVTGVKTQINEVDDFRLFWETCHRDGTIEFLQRIGKHSETVTGGGIIGVSRVEKNPSNRKFDFYIGTEAVSALTKSHYDTFTIEAMEWAIFESCGDILDALYEAEMYAFYQWLPKSGYRHAYAPELEVYPDRCRVQFWLPVCKEGGVNFIFDPTNI